MPYPYRMKGPLRAALVAETKASSVRTLTAQMEQGSKDVNLHLRAGLSASSIKQNNRLQGFARFVCIGASMRTLIVTFAESRIEAADRALAELAAADMYYLGRHRRAYITLRK